MSQTGSLHELPTHHSREAKQIAQQAAADLIDRVSTTDPKLTDSREWIAETISQVEAETGSATTRRAWTAQRVFQAINSWWTASSAATKLAGIQTGAQVNRALGTTAGTDCEGNDVRLSNSREWTANTVTQAIAEAGTDTNRYAWTAERVRQAVVAWWLTVTDVVKTAGNQSIGGVKTFIARSSHAGMFTPSIYPAHTATPTFDAAASNIFEPGILTSNVTSMTINNPIAGQTILIRFQQDGTGGRTVAYPAGASVLGTPTTTAGAVNYLQLTYSGQGARWEGAWIGAAGAVDLSSRVAKAGDTMTGVLTGVTTDMAMGADAGAAPGSFICRASGSGDAGLAGMSFFNNAYAVKLGVRADGYFGLGGWSRAAWSWYSDPSGNMVAAGNVTAYSDPRLKEDFQLIENPFDLLYAINGYTFNWRKGIEHTAVKAGKHDYGLNANEVESVMPELVAYSIEIDGVKYKVVAYDKIVPVLVEGTKLNNREIVKSKESIDSLRSELEMLRAEFTALKNSINQ